MNLRDIPMRASAIKTMVLMLAGVLLTMTTLFAASSSSPDKGPKATRLVTGLENALGSTIGPDGALYVTQGTAGRILRVDPQTGEIATFASGLPKTAIPDYPFGGPVDVAFIGKTAYALVTLVGPEVGGSDSDVVGIYRVDGPDRFTVVADIGAFSLQHPPNTDFFIPTGVQYALQPYRGGFLVTDGHHNRVLRVTLDGAVTEVITFANIVPTGLAVSRYLVFMAEAGPGPHRPKRGKVVAFGPQASTATEVASGAPLLVDVEFGPRGRLYALSQGDFSGDPEGSPALPNTGALVEVNGDGTFTIITDGLDRPTSLEFIGNTAYVVTLSGEIWQIQGVLRSPHDSRNR
jgi:sugar lactone lactonase YvrE